MSSTPSLSLSSLLGSLSFSLTPHIHLTILISARWCATTFSFLTGQVSLPCNMLLRTQLLYNLFLIIKDTSLLVSSGTNCLNYGHVLRKDDDDWVKKCMEYEVEGSRPRGRPKRTWKEVVREDCQGRKLNKEDAMDRCKWKKVIKEVRWPGWVWAGECFFWYRPTRVVPEKRPLNGCCCCRNYYNIWQHYCCKITNLRNTKMWFLETGVPVCPNNWNMPPF